MNYMYKPKQKKHSLRRSRFLLLAVTALLLLLTQKGSAQAPTISYPVVAADITRGYSQSTMTVKLVFNAVCSGTVRLGLPASVSYVPGTVTKTSGTSGVSIAESSIADLSKPTFSISGVAAIGDEITFTVARRAGCGSLATAKDSVYFIAGAGCSDASEVSGSVNIYNLIAPALSITPPSALTGAVLGTTATRTTTVTNGGTGVLDTLRFYIVYPSAALVNTSGTNAITANSVSFTPSSTSGDTLFYKIFGSTIFGGNNILSNSETVTILEPIRVVKCNASTTYNACWGATSSAICQHVTGTSVVVMNPGTINLSIATTDPVPVQACTPGTTNITYTNSGTGGSAGGIYNITTKFGFAFRSQAPLIGASPGQSLSNFRIGATSLTIDVAGTSGAPHEVNLSQLTADPDGAGIGLEDLDGDGQFDDLAPGKSFVVAMDRNFVVSTVCPRPTYEGYVESIVSYTSMCGTPTTTLISPDGGIRLVGSGTGLDFNVPTEVVNGNVFTVTYSKPNNPYRPAFNTTDSLELFLTLPAGFDYVASTATLNGTAVHYAVQTGTNLEIRHKLGIGSSSSGASNWTIALDLIYTSSPCTSGTFAINSELQYVMDRSCGAIDRLVCGSKNVRLMCIEDCTVPGMANYPPVVARQSLGWTDNTMSTKVSPATLSSQSLHTLTVGDTVLIKVSGRERFAYTNLHYYIQFDRLASGADIMQYAGATLYYLPLGSSAPVAVTLPAPAVSSVAALTKWSWDFSSLLGTGGLPSSTAAGDSVWIELKASVRNPNNGILLGAALVPMANASTYFYNIDGSGVEQYCTKWWPEIYILGIYNRGAYGNTGADRTLTGCSSKTIVPFFQGAGSTTYDVYKNEYRPLDYLDSVTITLPAGISWSGGTITHQTVNYNADGFTSTVNTENITGVIVRGQQIILINDGTWDMSDIPNLTAAYINHTFSIPLRVDCSYTGPTGAVPVTQKFYGRGFAYNPGFSLTQPIESVSSSTVIMNLTSYLSIDKTKMPKIEVQDNTGLVQGVKTVQFWDVQVNSTGTSTAPYVWMALEKSTGSGGVVVDSVKLMPSGTVVSPAGTYNGTDKWYQISTAGIASGLNQQARVFFHYTSCSLDSILLKTGWNCSSYPSPDPSAYGCVAASTYLKVDPQPSQVQLSIARQPGGGSPISLCTTDSTILVVNSAQSANLVNPYITIYPPTGLSLVTPIKVEYPRGSGDYQNATVTSLSGGGYKIDLSAHSGIGANGMLGTALANPSYTPVGGDRQAKVKVDFTTDCSYSSGSSFTFYGYGSRTCGVPATDDGISATTTALNITGASATGGGGGTMSFGTTTVSCGTATTFNLSTVPTGAPTQAGDTVVYTLPAGLVYAGGFTKGTNCTTCDIVASATSNKVKIKLQTGVAATSTLAYSFDVAPNTAGCGVVNVSSEFKRDITPLMCGATACGSSSVVIASGTSPNITLQKPSLQISNAQLVDTNMWIMGYGYPNKVWVSYNNNNGTQAYTGGADSIEFFCGTSTTSFATRPLTKSLAIGASDSESYIIYVAPTSCVIGELVTAKIKGTTSAGTQQCICSEASYLMVGAPLPLDFLSLNSKVNDCAVTMNWTYNLGSGNQIHSFVIERSKEGSGFSTVATLQSAAQSYIDVTPTPGLWLYRIKAIGTDGKIVYSSTMKANTSMCSGSNVSVYPNPVSDQLQLVLQGTAQDCRYTLTDALGRLVQEGQLQPNTNNRVSIASLPTATYLLKITVDGVTTTHQVHVVK